MRFHLTVVLAAALLLGSAHTATAGSYCASSKIVVQQACTQIPELSDPDVTELRAANLLRSWTASWIDVSAGVGTLLPGERYAGTADDFYTAFAKDEGGVFCWGAAIVMAKVYREFGFEAWAYAYGTGSAYGTPEPPTSHALTLVRVNGEVIIEDAYLNYSLVNPNHSPLSILETLELLRAGKANMVRHDEPKKEIRRDILYLPGEYTSALHPRPGNWTGNNYPAKDSRNMRRCITTVYGKKCSVAISYERLLRFYWPWVLNQEHPALKTLLAGRSYTDKLMYLMTQPGVLWWETDSPETQDLRQAIAALTRPRIDR